jgi:glutamate racemase
MYVKQLRVRILFLISIFFGILLIGGCKNQDNKSLPGDPAIISKALSDNSSIYYADYDKYPKKLRSLPIGMFDSGTGGLTVLEQFLAMDCFNNLTGEEIPDGLPDFEGEDFIYLADQANMPYGVYSSQNKTEYLRELIIKDALFLSTEPNRTKVIVIACNTATAYGLADVKSLLEQSGTGVKSVGVIEAGVDGALSFISKENPLFAVGVLATVGTIQSGGYENTIRDFAAQKGYKGDIRVVNQGGLGFAEAVDSEHDYISTDASAVRSVYRGPVLGEFPEIDPQLLKLYNFDRSGNSLLTERDNQGNITQVQLNSSGNYARFHLLTLIEKHRRNNPGVSLKSIILGCTHYPYLEDTLNRVISELREYTEDGVRIYDNILDKDLLFVDPALNTAKETYKLLKANKLLKKSKGKGRLDGYISVPHPNLKPEMVDHNGNLRFEFKYGRETGDESPTVRVVTFSQENINKENLKRIMERLPLSYSLIKNNLQ